LRRANAGLAAVLTVALLANLLQAGVARKRPNRGFDDDRPWSHLRFDRPFAGGVEAANVGFPSGEAATGFALAIVMTRVWRRGRWAFAAAAILAALARFLPGKHYVSDVAGSWVLAVLVAGPVFDAALVAQSRLVVLLRHKKR
jgi:membrane-associated phospholipid phosphatase